MFLHEKKTPLSQLALTAPASGSQYAPPAGGKWHEVPEDGQMNMLISDESDPILR